MIWPKTQILLSSHLLRGLKSKFPALELLAGPAASVREAKRLVEAGADGLVAGTGCDVGGDPKAPVPVALGRGEAWVFSLRLVFLGCFW